MIIRCPECSTGFKLPDERLSEDPIKVRCSKCKEVFRVGLVDGEAVRYDVDGNRLDGGDAGDANETQFGSPGTALGGATGDSDDDSPQDAEPNDGPDSETDDRDQRSTQRGTPATSSDAADDADAAEMKAGDDATAADDNSDDQSTADSDDDGARKQTLMGTPAAQPDDHETDDEPDETESSGRSKSSSPDYDPFPHANTGDQSDDADDAVGGLSQASSDAIETSDDEADDDPFADVLDDDEESSDSTADQTDDAHETDDSERSEDDDSASASRDESSEDSTDQSKKSTMLGLGAQQPGADDDQAVSAETETDESDGDDDADLSDIEVGDDIPQDDDSIHQQQQDRQSERQPAADAPSGAATSGATDAGSTVDDEFQQDREFFDPDEGRVSPGDSESSPQGPSSPGLAEKSAPSGPPGAAGPPGDGAPTSGADDSGRSSGTAASTASDSDEEPELDTVSTNDRTARQEATPAGPPESDWDVGATDRLDDAAYGSGWFQKVANVLLITLIVVGIGIAVGVIRAGGVYDFNRLSHMLQVTLHGDQFQPREAWQETKTPVETGPERDIEFSNVFASPLQRTDEGDNTDTDNKDNRWLVVRGQAKNLTDEPIKDLNVRVLLFDDNDKRIAEATAPLGATISDKKLAELESLENANFQPSPPASIAPQEAEPFTVIFPSPPKSAFDGSLVSYGVERVE